MGFSPGKNRLRDENSGDYGDGDRSSKLIDGNGGGNDACDGDFLSCMLKNFMDDEDGGDYGHDDKGNDIIGDNDKRNKASVDSNYGRD